MKYIVAHPGTQHSVRAAVGLKRAGMLRFLYTSVSLKRPPLLGAILRLVSPGAHERLAQHRAHAELSTAEIRVAPFELLAQQLGPDSWMKSRRRFGRRAGGLARQEGCGLLAFDGNAVESFRELAGTGLPRVLDQSIAHRRWSTRVGQLQCDRFPEWGDRWGASPELVSMEEEEMALADVIVCGSDFCADTMRTEGVPAEKLAVVPYGADTRLFTPATASEPRSSVRLLFVGALCLRKGFHFFAECVRRLRPMGIEGTAVGALRVRPEAVSPYMPTLSLPGIRLYDRMPPIYREHDIYVFPSFVEGSSLSIYEALASGLPVVTTPNAGSIVRHGVEGLIVPAGDLDALCEAVEGLANDRDRRIAMGRAARARAEECGDWAHYGERLATTLSAHTAGAD